MTENLDNLMIETRFYNKFQGMMWERFPNIMGDDFDHSKIDYVEFHIPVWARRTLKKRLGSGIGLFYASSKIIAFSKITDAQKNEYSYTNNIIYDGDSIDEIIRSLHGEFILQNAYYFKNRQDIDVGENHYVIYVSNDADKTTLKLLA